LQAKLEHRFSSGFNTLVAHTYSKSLQYNQSSSLGGNRAYEYARSPFDTPYNLAHYDVKRHDFVVEPGFFDVMIGASSDDIRLRDSVEVQGSTKK